MPSADGPILEVEDLRVEFPRPGGRVAAALDGLTFCVPRGKTLALMGESGSGKTLAAHALLRLIRPPGRVSATRLQLNPSRGGSIDLAELTESSELLYEVRGGLVGMVFQEPMSALSPVHTAGAQVAEAIWVHRRITGQEARRRAREMFARVGLPAAAFERYPHELSGGMRQRVLIAMALMCHPELIIADEPTTALDVALQRQILDLLRRMQDEIGCSLLLITHDPAVAAQAADEVAVMTRGRIVEHGAAKAVLREMRPSFRIAPSLAPRPPAEPLLTVRGLGKHFEKGQEAVTGVSFEVRRGETLGLVGESGAGKTTVARCILRAVRPSTGELRFRMPDGSHLDLVRAPERGLRPFRRQAQMIFQDPFAALNPRMTVAEIVAEPLVIHGCGTARERDERTASMLRRVGLDPEHRARYPHAFSGGQRQRIVIARALILGPSFVVCDEATSGLDAPIQRQILELLKELQHEFGLTYLFISHQLAVVRHFCDRVAVMQGGRIVEAGDTERIFAAPEHPHTRLLLSADQPPAAFRTTN